MGASRATTEFVVEAVAGGASLERTATVGRQDVFVGPLGLMRILKRHGLWPADLTAREFIGLFRDERALLDPLLRTMGAPAVTSIDISDYEGADVVHDLNEPIPHELERRFTLLFDGGSLEHVFDVPQALENYMRMVDVGGHLIVHTMANNLFGHGFYQFSPELFFRVLTPENGYEIERVVVTENDLAWRSLAGVIVPFELRRPWYEVVDPQVVRSRVLLQTKRPVVIQVQARRVADVPLFRTTPQQSDYSAMWDGDEQPQQPPPALSARAAAALPPEWKMLIAFDLLPALLRAGDPIRFMREARTRALRNGRNFRRVRSRS